MNKNAGSALLLLCAASGPAAAAAEPPAAAAAAGLSISGQWMRALPGGLPAAGYFTLTSRLDHPVLLVGAASPACGSLTLHQTVLRRPMSAMSALDPANMARGMTAHDAMPAGSMASMLPVAAVPVPAHGMIRFTPGGYHLMCEQPTDALHPGGAIPVTLRLQDGGAVATTFPVRGPRG